MKLLGAVNGENPSWQVESGARIKKCKDISEICHGILVADYHIKILNIVFNMPVSGRIENDRNILLLRNDKINDEAAKCSRLSDKYQDLCQ